MGPDLRHQALTGGFPAREQASFLQPDARKGLLIVPMEPQRVKGALAGRDLYLPLDLLPRLDGNKFYFHEVIGFRVVDSVYGDIGILREVIEYPAQPIFQIEKNGVEVLIPVVDEVIDKVDRELKTLFVTAPNGLIELYLGDINK